VGRIERQIAEERPILVPLDEPARFVGKDERAVALGLGGLGVAVEIVAAVVDVRVVVAVAGDVAEVLVEAAVRRPAAGHEAQVPLAEAAGRISGLGQIAWQDDLALRQADLLELVDLPDLLVQAVAERMPAGEQGPA